MEARVAPSQAAAVPRTPWGKLRVVLEMIKIEHTLFALPFALTGALLAARGLPTAPQLFWILVAMAGARSAAMAFNRLVDRGFDARNPRTAGRALPAALISIPFVIGFTVAASALLALAAYMLNPLAFALSPLALAIVFFYSFTKRFTAWSHAFLGLALSVAPVGAWIAGRGAFGALALAIGAAVVCWLIGFDIIYALQDVAFDREAGLRSLPAAFGPRRARGVGRAPPPQMFVVRGGVGPSAGGGAPVYPGGARAAALRGPEPARVPPDDALSGADLRRLNIAFFNLNIAVSAELLLFTAWDVLV